MKSARTLLLFALGALGSGLGGCASSDVSAGDSSNGGGLGATTDAASALRARFPAHASVVLEGRARFESSAAGLSPAGRRVGEVQLLLPEQGEGAVRLRVDAPDAPMELRVLEDDLGGPAEDLGTAVAYRRAGGTSYWTVGPHGPEEWLALEHVRRGEVAAAWVVEGGALRAAEGAIEILDARATPRMRVTAPAAYAPDGRAVEAKLAARDGRIELSVDAEGEVLVDPVWVSWWSLSQPRYNHTATTLPDGRIVFCGGVDNNAHTTATGEISYPSGSSHDFYLLQRRQRHAAALLPNDKVLLCGGIPAGSTGPLSSAEVYDPASDNVTSVASMSTARVGHTATPLLNGKVLVVGGGQYSLVWALTELFDPVTSTWSPAGSLSHVRMNHTATLLPNGKVLVVGGWNGLGINLSAELYDPATDTWAPAAPPSGLHSRAAAVLLPNGKVFVAGGGEPTTTPQKTAEIYDPATNVWTTVAPMAYARWQHTATVTPNGFVVVAGGGGTAAASAETWNPGTNTWTPSALNIPRSLHTASLLTTGEVLVAGGFDANGNSLYNMERFATLGQPCSGAANCPTGFCVDGVCCDSACGAGPCDACTTALGATADGTCTLLTGPSCNDGNPCTQADTCQAGACVGNATSDGSTCDDGDAQTKNDACTNGVCAGVPLCAGVVCAAQDQCHAAGTCDPTTGLCSNPATSDGSACDDSDANTTNDVCTAGVCAGVDHCLGVTCTASDECHAAGTCVDHATGACDNPAKTDGTPCSLGACQQGTCIASPDGGGGGGAGTGGSSSSTSGSTSSSGGAGGGSTSSSSSSSSGGAGGGSTSSSSTSSSGGAGGGSTSSSSTSSSGGAGGGSTTSSSSSSSGGAGGGGTSSSSGGASEDSGCGCRAAGGEPHDSRGWMGVLGAALILARRRRTAAASCR